MPWRFHRTLSSAPPNRIQLRLCHALIALANGAIRNRQRSIISDGIRRAISITFQIRRDLCELEQHYQIPLPLAGSTRCWLSDAYNSGRVHGHAMLGDSLTMIAATFTTELSNIDSRTSTGAQHRFKTPFDNCAFAGQRTVLHHIPPRRTKSRHVGTSSRDLKTANTQSSSRIAHFGHHSRPRGVYLGLLW